MGHFSNLRVIALFSALLLGGCSSSGTSIESIESLPPSSQSQTSSVEVNDDDGLGAVLPDGLQRMHDGTIIAVTEMRSSGEFIFVRVAVFNDQPMAVLPSAYFDLVDEEGRRSPNGLYPIVNLAANSGGEFNLSFRLEKNATPRAIAFGHELSAVNNEISLSEQDMKIATTAMQELRASYAKPQWPEAGLFEIGGVGFELNALKRCALSEGMALDNASTTQYFVDKEILCLRLDLTIENESESVTSIDPFLNFSLYDASGLVGLSADSVDGTTLWTTLNPGQKIRGDIIFVTTQDGPYTLVTNLESAGGGITFVGP